MRTQLLLFFISQEYRVLYLRITRYASARAAYIYEKHSKSRKYRVSPFLSPSLSPASDNVLDEYSLGFARTTVALLSQT